MDGDKGIATQILAKIVDSQTGPLIITLIIIGATLYLLLTGTNSQLSSTNAKLDILISTMQSANTKLDKLTDTRLSYKGAPYVNR